ncbi:MAG: chemotaxis protein CheC [Halobacteriota archaeon]
MDENVSMLSPFQKDALNELGNIASCHAVTALAEMTGMTLNIDVPTADVVPIAEVKKMIDAERIVAGISVQLDGEFAGNMQILFPEKSAFAIIDILMGKTPGETKSIATELEESALMEIGNILASSFCDAIADLLQFPLLPSTPSFSLDMMGAMIEDAIIAEAQTKTTEYIILLRCDFKEESKMGLLGYIMLFPRMNTLRAMLAMLEAQVN